MVINPVDSTFRLELSKAFTKTWFLNSKEKSTVIKDVRSVLALVCQCSNKLFISKPTFRILIHFFLIHFKLLFSLSLNL